MNISKTPFLNIALIMAFAACGVAAGSVNGLIELTGWIRYIVGVMLLVSVISIVIGYMRIVFQYN